MQNCEARLRCPPLGMALPGNGFGRARAPPPSRIVASALHLMAQNDIAAQFLNDPILRDQGLLSRLLVTSPATTMGTRLYRLPSPGALAKIAEFQSRLSVAMSLPLPLREGTRNELTPRRLRLSAGARGIWIEFSDHIERLLGPGGALEPISGFAAKMPEHAARLAAVLSWWHDQRVTQIDGDTMTGAIELVQHYAQEHLRLHRACVIPTDIADAQRLLEWLNERWHEPYISVRDICRLGPNSVRVARRARTLVKILVEHNHLRKVENGLDSRAALPRGLCDLGESLMPLFPLFRPSATSDIATAATDLRKYDTSAVRIYCGKFEEGTSTSSPTYLQFCRSCRDCRKTRPPCLTGSLRSFLLQLA